MSKEIEKPMFLTSQELIDLTHYKAPKRQIQALVTMGFKFATRPDGSVVVSRSHVEEILNLQQGKKPSERVEPKFHALDNL
jgi:hypothetical protein